MSAAESLPTATAVSVATTAPVLTLDECLRLARQRNEDALLALLRIERARAQVEAANTRLGPDASLRARATRGGSQGGQDVFNRASGSLNVETPLLDRVADNDVHVAGLRLRAEQERSVDARRQLAFAVADAYHVCLASDGIVEAAQRRVNVATAIVARERKQFAADLTPRQRVVRAELDLAVAEQAATAQRNAARLARLTLQQLIAAPADEPLRPLREPTLRTDALSASAAGIALLVAQARAMRSDVRALDHEVAAAQQAVIGVSREWVPRVVLGGDVGENWDEVRDRGTATWDVYLGATWTLYDGGSRALRSDDLRTAARMQALQLSKALRNVDMEIREALIGHETATVSVRQGLARLELAKLNARDVQSQAEAGRSTALDLADATAAEAEAEADLIAKRLAVARAVLDLGNALGQWPEVLP